MTRLWNHLLRGALAGAFLAAGGCAGGAGGADDAGATASGATARSALGAPGASGLVLTAEVGPLVLAPGDTLRTVLQVTNPGGDPLAVRFASGCLYGFALRDAAGAVVAPESPMCTMNAPVITFAAGESVVSGEVWVWDGAQPPPGEYDLTCGLGPRGEREHTTPVRIRLVGSRP